MFKALIWLVLFIICIPISVYVFGWLLFAALKVLGLCLVAIILAYTIFS